MATTITSGVKYSGIWTLTQVNAAISAGTWAGIEPALFSWGENTTGQLGLGNTTDYSSPKQVGALTTWSLPVSGGNISSCLKTDGTLWVWGRNHVGQLGLGDVTNRSSPTQVGALTGWLVLGAGSYSMTAIKRT